MSGGSDGSAVGATMGAADVVWRRAGRVAVVESTDRVALLNLDRPAEPPRILEGSAATIWWAVDGERATAEVVRSVASSFGLEPAEVEADVVAFVGSLAAVGLLEAP